MGDINYRFSKQSILYVWLFDEIVISLLAGHRTAEQKTLPKSAFRQI